MSHRVLSVGQCVPDQSAIRRFLQAHFEVELDEADLPADALEQMQTNTFDLVLINRKLDRDYSDGIEIIRSMKQDERLRQIPVMLVTNFAEYQQQAMELGAVHGFGKSEFDDPAVLDRLRPYLA